jgi:serine/threonine kinase 3
MCGSRYWMSPEMIQRIGYDTKTDIYSCGCVMFELMTGKAPYRNLGGLLALFNHATKGCEPLPPEDKILYSGECLNFFNQMVTHNQDQRPTASMLLRNTWLWHSEIDATVLESALNSAYEIPYYEDETTKRDKFKKNSN